MKRLFFTVFLWNLQSCTYNALDTRSTNEEYKAYAYAHDLRMPSCIPSIQAYKNNNIYGFSFEPNDPISALFMRDIIAHAAEYKDTTVLEIGCGMGILAARLLGLPVSLSHMRYVGVDICYDTLAIATRHIFEEAPHNYASWIPLCGEFPYLDFNDLQFTHIGLFYVAHFWTPATCVENLKKIESLLAPGGTVYIYTTHPYTLAYGLLPQKVYDSSPKEFPGYIDDAPRHFHDIVCLLSGEKLTFNESLRDKHIPYFLYLKPEELCVLMKKHTHLVIDYSGTITEHHNENTKTYTGIVAHKPL